MSRKRQNDASFPTGKQLSLENTQNIFVSIMTRPNMLPIRRCILQHVDAASGWSLSCAFPHFNGDMQVEVDEIFGLGRYLPSYMYIIDKKCKNEAVKWQFIFTTALHWSVNTPVVGSLLPYIWSVSPKSFDKDLWMLRGMLHFGANSAVLREVWTNILSDSFKNETIHAFLSGTHPIFTEYWGQEGGAAQGCILDVVQFMWEYVYEPNMMKPYVQRMSLLQLFQFCVATQYETQTFQAVQWLYNNTIGHVAHFVIPSYAKLYADAVGVQNISFMKQLWTNKAALNFVIPFTLTVDEHWKILHESVSVNAFMVSTPHIEDLLVHMFDAHGLPAFGIFWTMYAHAFNMFSNTPVPETFTQYMDMKYHEICAYTASSHSDVFELRRRRGFVRGIMASMVIPFEMTTFYAHVQLVYAAEIAEYVNEDFVGELRQDYSGELSVLLEQWGLLHLLH